MKNRKDIEKLADETLNSFEGIEPAEINEFIFTRIQNRLAVHKQQHGRAKAAVTYRLAVLVVMFTLLNISSYWLLSATTKTITQKTSGIAAFADDYNLQTSSYNY